MIEYRDGTFSDVLPLSDALTRLHEEIEAKLEHVRALHIGTPQELAARKQGEVAELQGRLALLELRVKDMEPAKSDLLHIPTPGEVLKVRS